MDNKNDFDFDRFNRIFKPEDFENISPDVAPEDVPLFALGNAMQREIDRPKTLVMNPIQLQKMNQMQKAINKYIEKAKKYPLNENHVTFQLMPDINQHDIELVLVLPVFLDFKELMQFAFSLDIDVAVEVSYENFIRVGFTIKDLYIEP